MNLDKKSVFLTGFLRDDFLVLKRILIIDFHFLKVRNLRRQ